MPNLLSDLFYYPFDEDKINELVKKTTLFVFSKPPFNVNDFQEVDFFSYDFSVAKTWPSLSQNLVLHSDSDKKYSTIFYLPPKNKIENFYLLALISKYLEKDGQIIAVLSNEAGGKNLLKYMNQIGFDGEIYSKSKARIFVGKHGLDKTDNIQKALQEGMPQEVELDGHGFHTQPGIFGWNKVDQGSQLLIDAIKEPLTGVGADFGCGYGYLSFHICQKSLDIQKLYCLDIDRRAVDAAAKNLEIFNTIDIESRWCDLTSRSEGLKPLDWVIMNPPFHDGKITAASLGQNMIKCAYSCLKIGGILYIVANKHLPYEKILNDHFRQSEKLIEAQGFKVFKAKK